MGGPELWGAGAAGQLGRQTRNLEWGEGQDQRPADVSPQLQHGSAGGTECPFSCSPFSPFSDKQPEK